MITIAERLVREITYTECVIHDTRVRRYGMDTVDLDAARRVTDMVRSQLAVHGVHAVGRWVAVRLEDGRSDGRLYDHKSDAIRHQTNEMSCAYLCIPPTGISVSDSQVFLRAMRQLYESGFRLADPDKHVTMR